MLHRQTQGNSADVSKCKGRQLYKKSHRNETLCRKTRTDQPNNTWYPYRFSMSSSSSSLSNSHAFRETVSRELQEKEKEESGVIEASCSEWAATPKGSCHFVLVGLLLHSNG